MQSNYANLTSINSKYLLVILAICVALFFRVESNLSDWKITHFLFSYEYEFLKRGLIGELLRISEISVDFNNIYILSLGVAVLFASFFVYFMLPLLQRDRLNSGAILFILIAISSPASLQHTFYDLGRFDVYLALIALTCLFLIDRNPSIGTNLSVTLLLCLLGLFIHEAMFFIHIPLIVMFMYYKHGHSIRTITYLSLFIFSVFISTYLISTHGSATIINFEDYVSALQTRYDGVIEETSLNVLYRSGLLDNLLFTLRNSFTPIRIAHHLIMFTALFPLFLLLFRVYKFSRRHLNIQELLLLLSAISPLALYPLGYDHFRWWSLAITNLFIAITLIMRQRETVLEAITNSFSANKKLVLITLVSGFILGPLAITHSFDSIVILAKALVVLRN